jgi:hypothetical protein
VRRDLLLVDELGGADGGPDDDAPADAASR